MIKAVVFDLDDTLYPEYDYVKSGYKAVAKEILNVYGIDNAYDELLSLFNEQHNNVFNRYLNNKGLPDTEQTVSALVDVYRSHMPNISLTEEVKQTLTKLRSDGYKLGIISDGRPQGQRAKISALGLTELVDEIIITDELGGVDCRKPNPQAFEIMANRLGVALDEIMYVGDNPQKDFAIGKHGVTTVKYNGDGLYGDGEYLDGIKEHKSIRNMSELKTIVEQESTNYDVDLTKKVQAVQVEIAEVIKSICEKNGIRYFLAYGTLIGAVRHDGFIPWDDDIDIMMPYPDLLKFEQACKTDLPEGYFYQSPETDPEYRLSIMRVCKDNTLLIEKDTADKNIHHGIFVDIYPIYGAAPQNKRKLQIFRAMKRALYLLDEPVKNHGAVMRLGSSFLIKAKTKKGKERAQKKLFEKISQYNYDDSENVVCLDSSIIKMRTEYKREWFGNGVMHKFGDTQFMIPENPDEILKKVYGDYMKLPPEDQRKPHHDFVRIDFDCGK